MVDEWLGPERRTGMFNQDFYNKIIEMYGDMKHVVKWIDEHKREDDLNHDNLNKWIDDHRKEDTLQHEKLNNRIRSLEDSHLKVVGGSAVLGALGAIIAKWFLK